MGPPLGELGVKDQHGDEVEHVDECRGLGGGGPEAWGTGSSLA